MSSASCYYPNGNPAQGGDIPCGSGNGVMCCPQGWTCKDNGLCYLANQQYLGRYTCTDKSWKASGCLQICTKGGTAAGDEAILDCGNGYCCDANRPDAGGDSSLGCCNTSPARFQISNRQAVSAGAPSPSTTSSSSSSSSSSSPTMFAVGSSGFSDPAASVFTVSNSGSSLTLSTTTLTSHSSVSTNIGGPAGASSTISVSVVTSIVTQSDGSSSTSLATHSSFIAAPATTSSSTPSQKSSVSASTIAPAVAVPVFALLLAALLFFFFWRRRKQRKSTYNSQEHAAYEPKDPVDMYAAQKPTLPEMDSPELKQSPNGTAPPSYRGVSGVPTEATGAHSRNSELPGSPAFPPAGASAFPNGGAPQHTEPSELEGNMYHAYRPPGR